MNCYYSLEKPAIGICKSCGRGISMEFATDVGNGLACKDHCEERVKTLNLIVDRNSAVLAVANKHLKGNMFFMVLLGLIFASLGVYSATHSKSGVFGYAFVAMGVAFIVRGILSYARSARYPGVRK
jgi:hypothetical protein